MQFATDSSKREYKSSIEGHMLFVADKHFTALTGDRSTQGHFIYSFLIRPNYVGMKIIDETVIFS